MATVEELQRELVELTTQYKSEIRELKAGLKSASIKVEDVRGSLAQVESDYDKLDKLAKAGAGQLIELRERLDGPPLKSDPEKKRPSYEAYMEDLLALQSWIHGSDQQGFGGRSAAQILPVLIRFMEEQQREKENAIVAEKAAKDKAKQRNNTLRVVWTVAATVIGYLGVNVGQVLWKGTIGSTLAEQSNKITTLEQARDAENLARQATPLAHLDYVEEIKDEQQEQIDELKAFRNRHEEKLNAIGVTVRLSE